MAIIEELHRLQVVYRVGSHKKYENGRKGRILGFNGSRVNVYWFQDRHGGRCEHMGWIDAGNLATQPQPGQEPAAGKKPG